MIYQNKAWLKASKNWPVLEGKTKKEITITPQQRKRLKLGLAERMRIRRRKEQERREYFYK